MKRYKLFYLIGLLFFLAAALNFVTGGDHATAVVWLCLGASFLLSGVFAAEKIKQQASPGGKSCRGCNSLRGSFVFQTEQRNFDKDEVRVMSTKSDQTRCRNPL